MPANFSALPKAGEEGLWGPFPIAARVLISITFVKILGDAVEAVFVVADGGDATSSPRLFDSLTRPLLMDIDEPRPHSFLKFEVKGVKIEKQMIND